MYRIKNHMQYMEFFGIDGILSNGYMMFTEKFINRKKVRFSKHLKDNRLYRPHDIHSMSKAFKHYEYVQCYNVPYNDRVFTHLGELFVGTNGKDKPAFIWRLWCFKFEYVLIPNVGRSLKIGDKDKTSYVFNADMVGFILYRLTHRERIDLLWGVTFRDYKNNQPILLLRLHDDLIACIAGINEEDD